MTQVPPVLIGITGGIGSGKSIVAKVFSTLGTPVYNSDDRARWLTNHDTKIMAEIRALFGPEAYDDSGQYNRTLVAAKVFANAELLQRLNGIIHPAVREDTRRWMQEHAGKSYLLKEAAIMSKAGNQNDLDYVIAVLAPEELRINRVLKRDPQRTREDVKSIIKSQVSDEYRMSIADFVIQNDEGHPVLPQVLRLHEKFSQRSVL